MNKTDHNLSSRIKRQLRTPQKGGWATDPTMTERRLIRLSPLTLSRLERVAQIFSTDRRRVGPMTIAALLLESEVKKHLKGNR
jgi:hypothetical protein